MRRSQPRPDLPGVSVLGGAGGGLSYEGALRDAVAREVAASLRDPWLAPDQGPRPAPASPRRPARRSGPPAPRVQ